MKINDLKEDFDLDLAPQTLEPFKEAFRKLGLNYDDYPVEKVRVQDIARKEKGNHRGIYFIFGTDVDTGDVAYFYIGLASKASGTIIKRFETHYLKLMLNLPGLYRATARDLTNPPPLKDKGATYEFPNNWKQKGVPSQFYGIRPDEVPDYRTRITTIEKPRVKGKNAGKLKKYTMYVPANLDWKPPKFLNGRNPDHLPVLIWDLSALSEKTINWIEDYAISKYKPIFNDDNETNKEETDLPSPPSLKNIMSQVPFNKAVKQAKSAKVKQVNVQQPKSITYKEYLQSLGISAQQILKNLPGEPTQNTNFMYSLVHSDSDSVKKALQSKGLNLDDPKILAKIRSTPLDQ